MLNALRHQRCVQSFVDRGGPVRGTCSTPYGIKGVSSLLQDFVRRADLGCSTPYGIKGVSRVPSSQVSARKLWVLNALRHQRCVQRLFFRWYSKPPQPAVLNALRHQRCVQRPLIREIGEDQTECSTPYGIKGVSRQHTHHHSLGSCPCSTPYGIKGVSREAFCQNLKKG